MIKFCQLTRLADELPLATCLINQVTRFSWIGTSCLAARRRSPSALRRSATHPRHT